MNLKDVITADIDDVFFDVDEFAEYHNIDGKQILCVVDENVGKERSNRLVEQYDGIYLLEKKVFIRKTDLALRPRQDDRLIFDGEPYIVEECTENAGVYEILLGLNAII